MIRYRTDGREPSPWSPAVILIRYDDDDDDDGAVGNSPTAYGNHYSYIQYYLFTLVNYFSVRIFLIVSFYIPALLLVFFVGIQQLLVKRLFLTIKTPALAVLSLYRFFLRSQNDWRQKKTLNFCISS